jgi:lipoate synthase
MLLHKAGIGNQWSVVRVLARKDGLLYLGTKKSDIYSDNIQIVEPTSHTLRPYGNYSESITVINCSKQ